MNSGINVTLLTIITGGMYYGFTVALGITTPKIAQKNIYHTLSEEVNF